MPLKLTRSEEDALWGRIDRARRFAEKEVHPDLKRARELYAGLHWPNMKRRSNRSRIVVNILWPAVETKVANLAFNYPDFTLRPLNREGAEHAEIAQHVISYDWRAAAAQEEARRALRDKETFGLGLVYDFWLWETEPVKGQAGVCVEGSRPEEAMEAEDATPDAAEAPAVTDGEDLAVRTDRPAARRISPFAFFVSPEADSVLANADYCGFVELRPVEDVKRDKRFRNTRGLVGSSKPLKPWLDEEARGKEDPDTPADARRVKLFHYFEKKRKIHAIFCEEHKKPLLTEEWAWEGDWYPFVVLRAADEEDCFFPTPPLLRIEHQQCEVNEARTQHSQWRRQAAPKFQTRGTLDVDQRSAVASSVAGTVVENVIEPLGAFPEVRLQPEVLQASQQAINDLQYISGLNAYETATPPTKRLTTSEVEAVRLSGGSRAVSDRQQFELFCSELARHFLAWEKQYSVRSRSLPIFDRDENLTAFRDYTRNDIRGEYLVEVAVGSTTAPKSENILEQIGFLLQSLPGFVEALQTAQAVGMDLRPLLPRLIKAALPDLRDVEQLLLSQLQTPQVAALPPAEGGVPEVPGGVPAVPGLPPAAGPGGGSELEALAALRAGLLEA